MSEHFKDFVGGKTNEQIVSEHNEKIRKKGIGADSEDWITVEEVQGHRERFETVENLKKFNEVLNAKECSDNFIRTQIDWDKHQKLFFQAGMPHIMVDAYRHGFTQAIAQMTDRFILATKEETEPVAESKEKEAGV